MSARLVGVVGSLTLVVGYAAIATRPDAPPAGGSSLGQFAGTDLYDNLGFTLPPEPASAVSVGPPAQQAPAPSGKNPGGAAAGRATVRVVSPDDLLDTIDGELARAGEELRVEREPVGADRDRFGRNDTSPAPLPDWS